MDASDAFIIASELVGLEYKFKISLIPRFLFGTFVRRVKPVIISGSGHSGNFTKLTYILTLLYQNEGK